MKGGKPNAGNNSKDKSGGFMGGGGGFGDIFNKGKANVQIYGIDKKIKTWFKHVAGMEGAK
jgi:hypothetical protein